MAIERERFGEAPFESVLHAARAGADWAWERIYDSLAAQVLGYLRARGAPDAEAVAGEVFCQLVRDIGRFEGDESGFRSWVFVMVHHRLLDDLRRRKRRPEAPADPEDFRTFEATEDVEATALRRAREREIAAAMAELTDAQREVVALRIFGGLKLEEVARATGRRVGAVKALQRRGLEALRRRLEAYPDASEGRLPNV